MAGHRAGAQRAPLVARRRTAPAEAKFGVLPSQQPDSECDQEYTLAAEGHPSCSGGTAPVAHRTQPLLLSVGIVGFSSRATSHDPPLTSHGAEVEREHA